MYIPDSLDAHQNIKERFEESMRAAAATLANSSFLENSLDDSSSVYSDQSGMPSLADVDDYGSTSTFDTVESERDQGEMFGNEHLSLMLSRTIQIIWSLLNSVMQNSCGDIGDDVAGGDSGSAESRRDQKTSLDTLNMDGLINMLLGLGLFSCALIVVFFGAVGLETLTRLDNTSDRSLARWIRDVCTRLRNIGVRTIELLHCGNRTNRTRSGAMSPTAEPSDTMYEAASSEIDDILSDTQVSFLLLYISFLFCIIFFSSHPFCLIKHHVVAGLFCPILTSSTLTFGSSIYIAHRLSSFYVAREIRSVTAIKLRYQLTFTKILISNLILFPSGKVKSLLVPHVSHWGFKC